jgi:acyl-CoA synthetase (AMP-forming)/AMP-acid ligase II|tara:strand:+ start:259 stop:783 length:525 start_codon:yes stop_codon:yes gene_type:complete
MLFDHLNKFSKRTALISENLEKLSYSELISRADKIGSQVTKKSLVFILCENNIDSIVAYVGFIRSGNTVCLLDQNINDELLKRIINLYQPSFIFSNKKKKIEDTNECEIKKKFLYENKKYKFGAYRAVATGNGKMEKGSEYYYFYRVEPLDEAAGGAPSNGEADDFKPSELEAN